MPTPSLKTHPDTGLLVLRLGLGAILLFHGIYKATHGVAWIAGPLAKHGLPAWMMYGARQFVAEPLERFGSVYTLLARRYYIDELYMWLIDKLVIGVGYALTIFDREALDGLVNGIAAVLADFGATLRTAQTGRVQNYGLVLFGGMAVIALVLVIVPVVRP